jgi:hypothetical protein
VSINDVIVNNDYFDTMDPAFEGLWLALFRGSTGGIGQHVLYQSLPMPQTDPQRVISGTLEFQLLMSSEETPDGVQDDWFNPAIVLPGSPPTIMTVLPEANRPSEESLPQGQYVRFQIPLNNTFFQRVAQEPLNMGFVAQNSENAGTAFLLDAVKFSVCIRKDAFAPGVSRIAPTSGALAGAPTRTVLGRATVIGQSPRFGHATADSAVHFLPAESAR